MMEEKKSSIKNFEDIVDNQYLRLDHLNRFSMIKLIEPETVLQHVSRMQALALYCYYDIENIYPGILDIRDIVYRCLIHDSSEIFCSDIPYPIKHATPEMEKAYNAVEEKLAVQHFPESYWKNAMKAKNEEGNENAYLVDFLDSLQCILKLNSEYNLQNSKHLKDTYKWSYKVLLDKANKYSKISKINKWYSNMCVILGLKWQEIN